MKQRGFPLKILITTF